MRRVDSHLAAYVRSSGVSGIFQAQILRDKACAFLACAPPSNRCPAPTLRREVTTF